MSAINWVFDRLRLREEALEKEKVQTFLAAGPILLLVTLAIGLHWGSNLDLAVAIGAGIFLCFSMQLRGFVYAVGLLILGAIAKHAIFLESHFWQVGIELSAALGFAVCALSASLLHEKEKTLVSSLENLDRSVSHLEEETSRLREETQVEKIALQSRLEELQAQVDAVSSENSSLQILNDVLRKSAPKREAAELELIQKDCRISELLTEIESLQSTSSADTRDRLLEELNRARVDREQTKLINETLARLHATADRKAKELSSRLETIERDAKEQQQLARERIADLIEQRAAAVEAEKQRWEEKLSERDRTISLFQERIRALSETQTLYFQLKQQFDEKNQVLHETRKELFRTETALQAARLEQRWEEVEFPLFETLLVSEMDAMEREKLSLELENAELSAIIGILSEPQAKKKSAKKKKNLSNKRQS